MKNTTTIFRKNWLALLLLAATTVVPWNLRAEVVYVTAPTVTIVSVTDTSVTLTVQSNYNSYGFPASPIYNFTFIDAANHSTTVVSYPTQFTGDTGTIGGLSPGTTYNMCLTINYGHGIGDGMTDTYVSNDACQSFTTTDNTVYTGNTNTGGGSAANTGNLPITTDSVSTCTAPRSILLTHIYGVTNYLIQADEFSSGKYVMDGSTDTVSFTNSSQPYYVNLLNGTLYHVYLHKACDINNQYWAHISSLTFFPDTIFLQATDVTDTSIIVSWDAGDAISANVKYVASGSTDTISFTTTMNTAMIYPLTPLTEYHIYVQAVYNDTVGYWEEITATTLEAQQNSGPLSLTLCDGTSINAYFPIYGFYMDASQHLQMIYPDSMLTALRGAEITQLTFYTSDEPSYSFDNIVTMSMAVTSSSQCGGSFVQESLETVSVDTVLIEDSMYVVTFDSPFTYPATGGNLLLDVDVQEGNSYQSIYFLGVNADGMSYMTYNSSTGGSSFLPKVTIDYELVTCAKPTDLMPVSVGATTATVAWTSSASLWNVKYVAEGQTDTVYQTVTSVNGITLSDLTPNQTTYYIYVQADCGATDGLSRWAFTSFTTECSEMPVPYNTNFEEFAEGVMPSCWDVNDPSATMAAVYQDGTMSHSGTQMLALSTEADTMVVLLPAFDSLSNLQLEFYAKTIEGYAIDSLEVGVMENNDFVPMASFVLGTSYQSDPYSVPFDTYAGTGGKMALRAIMPANMTQCGFVIDDVVVDTISDCTPVSNLITDNSTIGELQVSWNAGANETAWEVCYYYEGSDTTILQVSTPGLVITDVEFDTTYTVKVRANCGNNSYSNWRSAEVRSRCDYVMIPYEEDFENTELYTYPSCWEIQTNCSYYDANVYESGYQSSKALELYFDGETPEYEESYIIAMLPPMESLSGLQIEFNAMTYTQSTLQIGYMLGDQFVEVRSQALLSEFASEPYVVPITGNTGDAIQLAFRMADTNSSAIVFDNIVVDYIPSCPQVTALTATANGTNSIDLSWEVGSSETQWNVAYSTLGSNDTTVVTATTNPFTLTNLSPTTVYSIGVQARCSDSDSSSWTYTTAMTEAQFYHLPITSNFENDSVPWILENGTQTNHWMIGTLDNNNAIFITNDNANNTYTINSSSVVYAYMPVSLDRSGTYEYSFDWRSVGETDYDFLRVALMPATTEMTAGNYGDWTNQSLPSEAISLDGSVILNDQSTWTTQSGTFNLSEQQVGNWYFVLFWMNDYSVGNQPPAAVDNIVLDVVSCGAVEGLTVQNIGETEAELTWDSSFYEGTFSIACVASGSTDTLYYNNINAYGYSLNNLQPNTEYTVGVKIVCDTLHSSQWNYTTFTTLALAVTVPFVENFDSTTHTVFFILENGSQTNYWTFGNQGNASNGLFVSQNGTDSSYNTSNSSTVFAYVPIDLTEAGIYNYSYDWRGWGEGNYDYLRVALVPNTVELTAGNMSNWGTSTVPTGAIALDGGEQLNLQSDWNTVANTLMVTDNMLGRWNLVFFWRNDGSSGTMPAAGIDNISFTMPACQPPYAILGVDSTTTSAALAWTYHTGVSQWNVKYVASGSTDTVTTTTDTAYIALSNLTSSTTYYLYVQSACGEENSTWIMAPFATLCEYTQVPYECSFEDGLPSCWWKVNTYGTDSEHIYIYSSTNNAHQGSHYLYGYSYMKNLCLALPPFENLSNLQMTFYLRGTYPMYDSICVGVMEDTNFVRVEKLEFSNVYPTNAYKVSFANYTGTGHRPTFKAYEQSSNGYLYLDDIRVETIPICGEPINVTAEATTDSTALVQWDIDTSVAVWNLKYVDSGSTDTVYVNNVDTCRALLGQLADNSTFYVYVQSVCSDQNTTRWIMSTFTTPCALRTVPFVETFESYSNNKIPGCWTTSGMSSYMRTSNSYVHNGNRALEVISYGGSNDAILPEFADINTLMMTFYARTAGSNSDSIQVGVMESGVMVPLQTFTLEDFYQEDPFLVSFADYTGTGSHPCIRLFRSSGYGYAYIDDITIDVIPDCMPVRNISLDFVDGSSAELSWNAGGQESAWNVKYVADGTTDTTSLQVQTAHLELSNLQPSQTYHVMIQAACGNILAEWNSKTFTTTCDYTSVPYSNDFESCSTMPECWNEYGLSTYTQSQRLSSSSMSHDGNYSMKVYTSYDSMLLALPPFEELSALQMRFYLRNYYSGIDSIEVGALEGNRFIPIDTITVTNAYTADPFVVSFENYTGTGVRPAFRGRNINMVLDDLFIEPVNHCPFVTGITVETNFEREATISWTAGGEESSWNVKYVQKGATDTIGATVTTQTAVLTNLTAASTYYVYVQANCSESESSIWNQLEFEVPCEYVELPYQQGFEDSYEMPACWDIYSSTNSTYAQVYSYTSYAHNSSRSLRLSNSTDYVTLPAFGSVSSLRLSLYARLSTSNTQQLVVGVMEGGFFMPVDTVAITPSYPTDPYVVTFGTYAGTGERIALKGLNSNYIYVDDILVEDTSACHLVTGLTDTAVTASTAAIVWNTDASASAWQMKYVANGGAATDTVVMDNTTTPSVLLDGLTPNTIYHFYVRIDCGNEGTGTWRKLTFTTDTCIGSQIVLDTTICQGNEVVFANHTYHYTGTYNHAFVSQVDGCDSLMQLNLTVNPSYFTMMYDTVCHGETYIENGFNLATDTLEGTLMRDSLFFQTAAGCDSTIALRLRVAPTELGDFTYITPVFNQLITSYPVVFNWTGVEGATHYDIYLWSADSEQPATPMLSGLTSTYVSVPVLTNNTTYYWRLRAYNECAEKWSAVRNMTVEVEPALTTRYASLDFGEVELNSSRNRYMSVSGTALTDTIQMEIIGADASAFSYSRYSSFDSLTGGGITVTFHPTQLQENYEAAMVFTSGTLTDTTVLTGGLANYITYTAVVDEDIYSATDSIEITGTVINALNQAEANHAVEVYVDVLGYRRTFTTTSDANGAYSLYFVPNSSEAGYYTLGAGKHGVTNNTVMDVFNIPGMSLVSSTPPTWLIEKDDTIQGSIAINNRSNIPINNITVSYETLPEGAEISFDNLSIAGLSQGQLQYTVTGHQVSDGNYYIPINFVATATDGTKLNFSAWYYCQPQTSELIVQPQELVASVNRGSAKAVSLKLVNTGNTETGNLSFQMPNVDWMYPLVDESQTINVAVGDTAAISMYIHFDADAPLTQYTGSFVINVPNGDNVTVPYTISTVSDTVGDLVVKVADDYTYNTNNGNGPYLQGARVVLRDYYSLDTVMADTTNANGEVSWENIPEGYYRLYVSAQRHSQETRIIEISAAATNTQNIFLTYQAVSYEWVVERTEIEDHYELSLTAVFETNVPAPTLVIEAPTEVAPPDQGDSTVFNIVVTNYGLISAYNFSLTVPMSEEFTFTPLFDHIDTMEALHAYIIPCVVRPTSSYTSSTANTCNFYFSGIGFYYCNKGPEGYEWKQLYCSDNMKLTGISCPTSTVVPTTYYHTAVTGGGYVPCSYWCNGGSGVGGTVNYVEQPVITTEEECENICVNTYQEAAANAISAYGSCGAQLAAKAAIGGAIAQGEISNCLNDYVGTTASADRTQNWVEDALNSLTSINTTVGEAMRLSNSISDAMVNMGNTFAMLDTVTPSCEVAYTMGAQLLELLPSASMQSWLSAGTGYLDDTYGCVDYHLDHRADAAPNADKLTASISANAMINQYYNYADDMLELIGQLYAEEEWGTMDAATLSTFVSTMDSVVSTQQLTISAEGKTYLLNHNANISSATIEAFVDRWNRSLGYWCQGWYTKSQVTAGNDTNFVELNSTKLQEISTSVAYMYDHGYVSPYQMCLYPIYHFDSLMLASPHKAVCARVTVKFTQRVAMTREAFDGTLTIFNGSDTNMTQVQVNFVVKDAQGVDKSDLFQINTLSLDKIGSITNGTINRENEATIKMRFIPERDAAPTEPVVYYFGGSFSYYDLTTGSTVSYDFVPVDITVNPSPNLEVDYFLQRYILGDDALTTNKVEPSEPATLAMRFSNIGYGAATGVTVESMQPEITENENGLAIDFQMIGSLQNGNDVALGLTNINLGDIAPSTSTTAEWLFTSSLLGRFTPLSTNIIHNDSYGNPDLSLITSLRAHQLIHLVTAYGSQADGRNDFLVNDVSDVDDYPDSLYYSQGGRTAVSLVTEDTIDVQLSDQDSVVHLTMTPTAVGWNYVRTEDPGDGQYEIVRCVRDDGQEIPLTNVWLTFVDLMQESDPVYVNRMHLVDTIALLGPDVGYNITFRLKPGLLEVSSIENLPSSPIDTMLTEFDVVFNKPLRDSTFTYEDMTLKCNNGENLMDSHVTITQMDDTRYRVTLNNVNHYAGLYVITVNSNNIIDLNGYAGHDGKQGDWTQTQASVPTFYTNIYDTICQYETYTDYGFNADTTGTYTQSFSLTSGFDSVVNLYLTVLPVSHSVDVQTACDSYTWRNSEIYTVSNNNDSVVLVAANGCDSVITLNLTLGYSSAVTDVQVACDSMTWIDGVQYTASNNTATHTLTTVAGCDSVITLNLTMNYSTASTDVQTVCDSYTWMDATEYTASNNTATYTTTNAAGCDSVITLNLTIHNSTASTDVQTSCDSYTWINGETYTASNNTATDTLTNVAGCDSVITLNLTVNYSNTGLDVQTACDSYTWIDGNTYTEDVSPNDNVTFTLTNVAGCDSVVTLNLTMNHSNTGTDVQTACDSYTWIDGLEYTASNNTATYTLTNEAGCDSVVTLNLTVNYSTTSTDVQTACDSYMWRNQETYTASVDTATFTLTNAAGCDSVITLNLTINYSTSYTDVQTACDSYTWINGETYTEAPAAYAPTDTLVNAAGCDSVITLNLTVNYSNTGIDEHTACDSYTWIDGNTYTEDVSPNDNVTFTLTNVAGCDSVVTLHLTMNHSNTGIDVQTACDSYTWIDGNEYTASNNTATYTLTNEVGCDSVVTLNLTVNYSTASTDVQTACDSFTWMEGVEYTASNNTATHTMTNAAGCDSVMTLNLTINYSTNYTDVQTACDSYTWINGETYTEAPAAYAPTHTLVNAAGCDSVVTLNLTMNYSNTGTDVQTACDSYTWIDGLEYTASNNTAIYTLTNAAGCDSVVTINLTINNSSASTDVQTACDSYTWIDGNEYTSSNNTATYTTTNAAGCDSVVTLNLTINNSNASTDIQTACDSYTWINGETYTASNNTATYTTTNVAGCDSVITLNLTVNYSNTGTDVQTACDSYTWIDGITYTEAPATYAPTYTLTNAAGCDSVVTLNLTMNYSSTGIDVQSACDSYTWIDGVTYTSDNNSATYTLTNAVGCDSVVTLNLTMGAARYGTDVQTACDSYTWIDGNEYTASNSTATYTTTNAAGCDSVITLNLTINNSSTATDVQTACDSYTWMDGNEYTASNNTATYTTTNAAGCDSVITLNLTINNSSTATDVQTACDSYTWMDGNEYTASNNTATYTTTNAAGCDSVITLNLTINNSNTATDVQTACDSYTWIDGNEYTTSNNTATYTTTNAAGCDSVITLNLTINNSNTATDVQTACDSYTWMDGNEYTASNSTATYTTTNAAGCDSVITLNLTINNSSSSTQTVVACDSYTWVNGLTYNESTNTPMLTMYDSHGCDSVVTLNLTIGHATSGVDVRTACDSFTWIDGVTYTENNTTATYTLTNTNGCDSTVTLNLTIGNVANVVDEQSACESYTWIDGITYTASNSTATFTMPGSDNCDSIITLHLTINHSNTGVDTRSSCESLLWIDGNEYTASNNTATYTLTNAAGCDSVVTLQFTFLESTIATDVQSACDSYIWIDGNEYTASNNTVTYTTTNAAGCDSVITLNLTINNSSAATDVQSACDSYTWMDGNEYTASNNTATYTTTNAAGCDSVITLNLTINSSSTAIDEVIACDSHIWIDGNEYTASNNTATYTITNAAGCDSVITLNLTINNSSVAIEEVIACDSFTWKDGNEYTASNNTATYTISNAVGCDSVTTLNLTINNSNTATDVQSACDSYIWIDGITYTASNNTATYTTINAAGCDSVITLNLTINNSSTATDVQSACDSYTWINGLTYTASINTATITTTNAAGCDSVITLNLTINSSSVATDVQSACDSYTWIDGNEYTASNSTATYIITNAAGCDSVITLNLTINSSSTTIDEVTACDNYTWIDGVTYTASNNTATYTITNAAGCDSVITLNLTINNSNSATDVQSACDSFTWIDGVTYTASNNTATYSTTNAAGCDSVITLNLTINNSNSATDVQSACDSYTWIDGITYTASNNTATYILTNAAGCDSVITLNLTINSSSTATDVQTACDSYTWIDGITYTASNNTATYTLTNAAGCDSVITLNLTILPNYTISFNANGGNGSMNSLTVCSGQSVQLSANSFTYTGYNFTGWATSANGQVVYSDVDVITPTANMTLYAVWEAACNNIVTTATATACDSYSWRGNTYVVSGTYNDTVANAIDGGCDSIYQLVLTINNSTASTFTHSDCGSYTWIDGNTYTASTNTPTYTFTNTVGCDSVVTLHLTIHFNSATLYQHTACDSYTWHGTTYTTSTNGAIYTTTNAAGCDSVVTMNLTINYSDTSTDVQSACDSYTWHGTTYTTSTNSATYTATNAAGCDSVINLNLTINSSSTSTDVQSACDNYVWMDGNTYTASNNTATYTTTNAAGCDSVITLNLTINNSTVYTDVQSACDSFTWMDGNTYTQSNNLATYTLTNAAGCDSVITLNLTINNSVQTTIEATACDSYTWDNDTYTESGEYVHHYTAANSCDSTVTLQLTVNYTTYSFDTVQSSGSFTWIDGTTYTVGDTTILYTITNVAGCDSVMSIHIIVIEDVPVPQIVAYNNRVLMVVREYGDTIVDYLAYQWYRNGEPIEGATSDYYNNEDNSLLDGCYYVMVPIDEQYSSWVMSNILCFGGVGIDDVEKEEVSFTVAPNPVLRGQMIRVEVSLDEEQLRGARLEVYDMRGAIMYQQPMEQSTISFNVAFPSGSYIVRLRTAQGIETVKRFVVK